jgi:pimeloyl-ACP methyl ester carboxylesterase
MIDARSTCSVAATAGATLHVEQLGTGEPVIALHGLAENTEYWVATGVAARIAERHGFVGFDMRGHGRSTHDPARGQFDVPTIADDIGAVADALGLEQFHLLAHATGGMAACDFAIRYPERVRSLMLTNSSSASGVLGPPDDAAARERVVEQYARFFEVGDWEVLMARMRVEPRPFLDMVAQHPDAERLWGIVEHIFRLGDPNVLAAFVRSCYRDPDPRLDELARLDCPALILCGDGDRMMRPWVDVMAGALRQSTTVILDGVGHMTAIEAPDATADALLRFLATVSGAAPRAPRG